MYSFQKSYQFARDIIKKTPGVNSLAYSAIAWRLENKYRSVRRKYERKPLLFSSASELLMERSTRAIERIRNRAKHWRIIYVGSNWDQDSSGLLQGLGTIGEVNPFYKEDGDYGQMRGGRWVAELAQQNAAQLYNIARMGFSQGMPYDIVIGQMWDGLIQGSVLSRIRDEFGCVVINIGMDDRHTFWGAWRAGILLGTQPLIPHIDLALTAAPEIVSWYLKERCPALYFPEASDPSIFRPIAEARPVDDVCFIGKKYGIREEYVEALQSAGVSVTAYGNGWPNGRIALGEVPEAFARSKIILGLGGVGQSRRLVALKLRDFDATMSGTCYITQDNPDLRYLFDVDREIVLYRTKSDLVAQVKALLADDVRRNNIGRRGRQRAVREHAWTLRFAELREFLLGETQALTPQAHNEYLL